MADPFTNRAASVGGPARDIVPVTPDDAAELGFTAVALYVETAGAVTFVTAAGATRTVAMGDHAILPVGARQVLATGTTAAGIHAFRI